MFGLEEPYLYIKVIFVGVSSVLWLVLGFGWKFRVKRGKLLEIAGEYRYSKLFLVYRILSTVLKVVFGPSTGPATLFLFCSSVNFK